MSDHIFISHATADDDFVKQLRVKLELHDLTVWVDSRNLRGGDQLKPEIEQAIQTAKHVLVVLSPNTINSTWVREEIQLVEQVAKDKDHYRVIPLMLPRIEPAALNLWFKEEPAGIKIQLETGKLQQKMPDILAALGERLPDDVEPAQSINAKPIAELLLELSRPKLTRQDDGSMQLSAEAQLEYISAEPTQDSVHSKAFHFIAPIGQIEQDDLRWYLERYPHWPTGLFQKRAKEIEARLPQWGQALFDAILTIDTARVVVSAWEQAKTDSERRFSIRINADTLDEEQQDIALQAASKLISLPWELLHSGEHWLSDGAYPVRIRRRLPNHTNHPPLVAEIPIRILLLSPRPEQAGVGYIDHRASAQPLVDAVANLGDLVELTVLTPPTLVALQQELKRARDNQQPYHVVHFDGHGVYNPQYGLGALCFEDPKDSHRLDQRAMQLVYAKYDKDTPDSHNANIASLLKDYRIPLVFLEACQTAQSDINPNASVAVSLLEEGVASVVAMSHSVLVKSATLFVTAFYQALAQGQRVGQAMLAGQNALKQTSYRFPILGAGELHLQDWFVPILYQEKHDPQLFQHIPSAKAESLAQQQQHARLGKLPASPSHSFIGRTRELLTLERLLENQPYAVIAGQGGMGKTTLAVELARWLVRSGRFDRCAFVSLEEYSHDRAVLDELGRQLVGDQYSVAEYGDDLKTALQPIQRVLENESCLLLLDNMESLLADCTNLDTVLALINSLLPVGWVERSETQQTPKTRLLFTTREKLPAPFHQATRQVSLSELSETDAKALIMRVMAQQGLDLKHDDQGRTPEEVNALVNAVGRHARALVLLAQQLAIQGVTATTENLQNIMQELEKKHPGQREKSLYASVELSLQRLSAESRERIKGLAVLHDGVNIADIAHILDIEVEAAAQLSAELIQVGLAEQKAYTYLRLDPALPNYLALQLQDEEKQHYRLRWSEVISQLVDFLLQQRSQDAILQSQLTQLEFPNLMAFIRWLNQQLQADQADAETVTNKAGSIEQLLEYLDYPQALAEVVSIRQQAAEQLGEWSPTRFVTERLTIERLLDQSDIQAAFQAAQTLQKQCEQAGAEAYTGADYDLAIAHILLGRILQTAGAAAKAQPHLQQAFQRFDALGERGAGMASKSLTELGDCLRDLGQLEQAVAVYKEGIQRSEKLDDARSLAVKKGQLATVYRRQKDYPAALQAYDEARALFQQFDEPGMVAVAYHQIGMVYKEQSQFEQAESAYRQSLAIKTQQGNRAGEAASLGELANLYNNWNRPEQAVDYYRQAADIYTQLGDQAGEGRQRNNLANTLIKLKRLNEARPELLRGIECVESFGHAAEPWKTWATLHNLELSDGNPQAAQQARQKAIHAFLSYRRDGGENHSGTGRLALMVLQSIQQNDTADIEQFIEQLLEREDWQQHKTFLHNLQAILAGDRNLALAEDEEMNYELIVELKLLLEQLQ